MTTRCLFVIPGDNSETCPYPGTLDGICDQHLGQANHIVQQTDYDGFNQMGVCSGIIKSHDHYPACDNSVDYGARFCKTHHAQNMGNNLAFVNFIREKQGLPTFMDWEYSTPFISQVRYNSLPQRTAYRIPSKTCRTDFPSGDYGTYPTFSYPRENFKYLF